MDPRNYAYIFKKANINSAVAYIPVFYKYFLCKLADEKGWKMIFLYIPIVSIVYRLILSLKLAKVFNKSESFSIGIFLLPVLVNPIPAFNNSEYSFNNKSSSNNQKSNNKIAI